MRVKTDSEGKFSVTIKGMTIGSGGLLPNTEYDFDAWIDGGSSLMAPNGAALTLTDLEATVNEYKSRSGFSDLQIGYRPAPELPKFVTPEWLHDIAIKSHNRYVAECAARRAMAGAKMMTALQMLDRMNAQIAQKRAQREMNTALFGEHA